MAVSSDGSFIVYSAIPENPGLQARPQIYLRRLSQMDAAPIAGTEGGISPFLSPDGRSVGCWTGGKVVKTSVEGGVPTTLCDASLLFGASWGLTAASYIRLRRPAVCIVFRLTAANRRL